jgi:predicted cupin superfamily sugar epimerase
MYNAKYFVEHLSLLPHPEGGWYVETYRAPESILKQHLPPRFTGDRSFSTAIYFLLEGHHFSAFHRIKSDELWHFYYGGALNVYVIHANGELKVIHLGPEAGNGEVFQAAVKEGCWFASRPANSNGFSLVGCTVSPGFDFSDFEMAKADELMKEFPQHEEIIRELCR